MAQAQYGNFSAEILPRAAGAGWRRAHAAVLKRGEMPERDERGRAAGPAMVEYLERARGIVEQEARDAAEAHSPFAWMMYLRQLPTAFWAGKLATTAGYDAALADAVTGISRRRSPLRMSDGLTHYSPDGDVNRDVGRLCGMTLYLSQIHTWLRWAQKGVEFSFDAEGMAEARPTAEQRAAVELYDRRVAEAQGRRILRTGTAIGEQAEQAGGFTIPAVGRLQWKQDAPRPLFEANFILEFASLDGYARLNRTLAAQGLRWWSEEAPVMVAFLRLLLPLVTARVREHPKQILGRAFLLMDGEGVAAVPRETLEDAAEAARCVFPGAEIPATAAEIFRVVEGMKGMLWPPLAPAVRREGGVMCVDLHGATQLLQAAARFEPKGGVLGKERGGEFERSVQALIDGSACAPPPEVRALVGRDVYEDGRQVTDIDAIAVKGRTLVLISCKSREYSAAMNRGEAKEMEAVRKLASEALAKYEELKGLLETQPASFEGVDLSRFAMAAVVCLPFVPYLPLGRETEFASGTLRSVVSIDELDAWLRAGMD